MKLLFTIFFALVLSVPVTQSSNIHCAAPYGNGSICSDDTPCNLSTALALGGEVQLLPGTYHNDITISIANTLLRSVPGIRAKIDGGLTVSGANVPLVVWDNRFLVFLIEPIAA